MSKYRTVHKCATCGKIYRFEYWPNLYSGDIGHKVCGRCGTRDAFYKVIAKPRLFGLLGWKEKE